MNKLLIASSLFWAGGVVAWWQANTLSDNAMGIVLRAEVTPIAAGAETGLLVERIDQLEQTISRLNGRKEGSSKAASATEIYDRLRQLAHQEGVDLTGAEGLGLVPQPLAAPAALRPLFEKIFEQSPARVSEVRRDGTDARAGYTRVRITVLCDSGGMGAIVGSLAEPSPWMLAGVQAVAAPHVALENPLAVSDQRMAVELSLFVDVKEWEGGDE